MEAALNGAVRLTLEPWRVCRLVVVDSRHLAEEPERDPYQN